MHAAKVAPTTSTTTLPLKVLEWLGRAPRRLAKLAIAERMELIELRERRAIILRRMKRRRRDGVCAGVLEQQVDRAAIVTGGTRREAPPPGVDTRISQAVQPLVVSMRM